MNQKGLWDNQDQGPGSVPGTTGSTGPGQMCIRDSPLVIGRINNMLKALARDPETMLKTSFVVLDVPLLFETGLDKICNEVWVCLLYTSRCV